MNCTSIANRTVTAVLKASTQKGAVSKTAAKQAIKNMPLTEFSKAVETDPGKMISAIIERIQKLTTGKVKQLGKNMEKIDDLYNLSKLPGGSKVDKMMKDFGNTPRGKAIKAKSKMLGLGGEE